MTTPETAAWELCKARRHVCTGDVTAKPIRRDCPHIDEMCIPLSRCEAAFDEQARECRQLAARLASWRALERAPWSLKYGKGVVS